MDDFFKYFDQEKARKIEDYANSILGFCSDESNNPMDVLLIMALASAKMLHIFGEYVEQDDDVQPVFEKERLKKEFDTKYLWFLGKFQEMLKKYTPNE